MRIGNGPERGRFPPGGHRCADTVPSVSSPEVSASHHRAGVQPPPRGPGGDHDGHRAPSGAGPAAGALRRGGRGRRCAGRHGRRRRRPRDPRRRGPAHRRHGPLPGNSRTRSPTARRSSWRCGARDDRWLATWSQADAVLVHPLDPLTAAETVADVLRRDPRRAARARLRRHRMGDVQQTWPALLARLLAGTDLDAQDTAWVMDQVLAGDATPVQLAGFLVALRSKGETAAEITGLAEAMLRHARRVAVDGPRGRRRRHRRRPRAHREHLDDVGRRGRRGRGAGGEARQPGRDLGLRGGGRARGARGGARPAARGGRRLRRARSASGSASRPVYHPSMRHTSVPRRELGIPTAINVLGPLTNPAQPRRGPGRVRRSRASRRCWRRCSRAAARQVLVVRGDDGLDELTTTGTSTGLGGRRRRGAGRDARPRRARHRPPPTRDDLRGGDPRGERRRVPRACSRGSPGRCATRCCSTPRARWSPRTVGPGRRARWPTLPGGAQARGRRDRHAAPRATCWTAGSRCHAAGGVRVSRRTPRVAHATARNVREPGAVCVSGAPGSGQADGERGVGVDLGVRAERDVGVGVLHPGDLRRGRPAMTSASSSWASTRTMATRSTSPAQE